MNVKRGKHFFRRNACLTFLCSALWGRFFKKCYYTNIGKFVFTRSRKGKDLLELVGEGKKVSLD